MNELIWKSFEMAIIFFNLPNTELVTIILLNQKKKKKERNFLNFEF